MSQSTRSLLLPGPQPPLSHFGATLLRHVTTTGLRYALHSLGVPIPPGAPSRIVRLRFYLDGAKLERTLEGSPAADATLGALLEPSGSGPPPRGSVRGALLFHGARLRAWRRSSARSQAPQGGGGKELWEHFQGTVSRQLPALNDALLGEIIASFARRSARARGARPSPCLGREAHAFVASGRPDLAALGVADPVTPDWSESPAVVEHLAARTGDLPTARRHPLRGRFRELYRRALEPIRRAYLRLAERAHVQGLIEEPGDAFFIPFDLVEDLARDEPAEWLPGTVTSNRAEYQSLLDTGTPAEVVEPGPPRDLEHNAADWALAPLWPLD